MIVKITSSTELDECYLKYSDKIIVLKFTASWCGPCKRLAPLLEKIAETQDDIIIAEIIVDENKDLCKMHNVQTIPHCVIKSKEYTSEAIKGFNPDGIVDELKLARDKKRVVVETSQALESKE